MNYYSRITELISADQVIAESTEQQERIDELLGRIGRAMGAAFSSKPASPYFGQWNPLRGKYEGGLGKDERMAAIAARVKAKKAAKGPPAPEKATAQDFEAEKNFYAGLSKPEAAAAGAAGAAKPVTPAPTGFRTPAETKIGMPKSMGNIGKLPSATPAPAPAKPNLLAPPKSVKNIMPPTGDEFGAGIKDAPKFKPTGKKVPVTAPTSAGFRTPAETKIGIPKSRGNIGKLPSAAPAPFDPRQPVTPGAQPQATGGRKAKKAVAQQGQGPLPQQGQGPKPAPTRKPRMSPEEKSAKYTNIDAQEKRHQRNLSRFKNIGNTGNQDIAGRFASKAALNQSWQTALNRLNTANDIATHNRTITDPKLRKLHQNSSTYYGEVANLIRESFQLNEKKKGPCWKGYEAIGMKMKGGRKVPNCVPKSK